MPYAQTRFHAIGQGCFYTAEIYCTGENDPIRFAYDCGSHTGSMVLEREVDLYHQIAQDAHIDALIISHLDEDHVNGLPLLLDNGMTATTVFMPYLNPIQRAVAAGGASDKAQNEYFQFLANPVVFLQSRGVRNVVFIRGNSDDDWPGESSNGSDFSPQDGDGNFPAIADLENDKEGEILYQRNEKGTELPAEKLSQPELPPENPESKLPSDLRPSNKATLHFKTDRNRFRLARCWLGKFMHKDDMSRLSHTSTNAPDFAILADDTTSIQRYKRFLSEVYAAFGTLDSQRLVMAIRNEVDRQKLQRAYRHIRGNHNDVSLVLWHGPHDLFALSFLGSQQPPEGGRQMIQSNGPNGGTLLTGDLTCGIQTVRKMERHFAELIFGSAFLHVPHHGSKCSWNSRLLSATSHQAVPVISAGIHNSHNHPHPDVVMALNLRIGRNNWHKNHEHNGITMEIIVPRI